MLHDRFDVETRHVFIGDHSGQVTILKLEQENCTLITTFRGHTGGIKGKISSELTPAACSGVHMACCESDKVMNSLGLCKETHDAHN